MKYLPKGSCAQSSVLKWYQDWGDCITIDLLTFDQIKADWAMRNEELVGGNMFLEGMSSFLSLLSFLFLPHVCEVSTFICHAYGVNTFALSQFWRQWMQLITETSETMHQNNFFFFSENRFFFLGIYHRNKNRTNTIGFIFRLCATLCIKVYLFKSSKSVCMLML